MLRRSIAITSGGTPSSGAKKRNSIKVRKQSIVSNKTHKPSLLIPADGRESLRVTIAPERIDSLIEYVKFFVPMDHLKESFSLEQIERLFYHPLTTDDPSLSPELLEEESIFQTMLYFSHLLQTAQMDHLDWFEFVLSRNNASASNSLTLSVFVSEIIRLAHDLRQGGIAPERLTPLFLSIIHNKDETYTMDRAQLDTAIKKFHQREQLSRMLNGIAADLHPVSLYMKKNRINFYNILQMTGSADELEQGMIHISQLQLLISSLLLMYEIYVTEHGVPIYEEPLVMTPDHHHHQQQQLQQNLSPKGNVSPLTTGAPSNPSLLVGDSLSKISDLTPWSNLQTQRSIKSDLDRGNSQPIEPGTSTSSKRNLNSTTENENVKETEKESEKDNSAPPSGIGRMMSFKSFKLPNVEMTGITTTVGNMLTSFRKSISFRSRNASIAPADTENQSAANKDQLLSPKKSRANLPVEVNSEFLKHLEMDERIKVVTLVRHMREGESDKDKSMTAVDKSTSHEENEVPTTSTKSIQQRYSVAPRSMRASADGVSEKFSARSYDFSMRKKEGNYIIISTDENDIDDILAQPIDANVNIKQEPTNEEIVQNLVNGTDKAGRRRGSVVNTNRMENMKNEMIQSFNRRISIASVLIKYNR